MITLIDSPCLNANNNNVSGRLSRMIYECRTQSSPYLLHFGLHLIFKDPQSSEIKQFSPSLSSIYFQSTANPLCVFSSQLPCFPISIRRKVYKIKSVREKTWMRIFSGSWQICTVFVQGPVKEVKHLFFTVVVERGAPLSGVWALNHSFK